MCFPTILQVDVSDCFVLCHGRFKVCELCQTSSQMEVGADFVSCLLALSKAFNILQPRNCVEVVWRFWGLLKGCEGGPARFRVLDELQCLSSDGA